MQAISEPAWTVTDGVFKLYISPGPGKARSRQLWTADTRRRAEEEAAKWRAWGYPFVRAVPWLGQG